jgi:hypothetical protein
MADYALPNQFLQRLNPKGSFISTERQFAPRHPAAKR